MDMLEGKEVKKISLRFLLVRFTFVTRNTTANS